MATASNNPFQMLTEIDADTLAHLLTDVHANSPLWTHPLTIPQSTLDHFLSSLNPGDVLEIQGPPASAKTHFLYYILSHVITAPNYRGTPTGGWGKAAIVFDMDSGFDIARLIELMKTHLASRLDSTTVDIADFARSALSRLHVFRPTSSTQLAATIGGLPNYHATNLAAEQIALVAIDPVSAHYWPDRFKAEQLRNGLTAFHHIQQSLNNFRRMHGNITVVTSWNLQSNTRQGSSTHAQTQPIQPTQSTTRAPSSKLILPLAYHITMQCAEITEGFEAPAQTNQEPSSDSTDQAGLELLVETRNSFTVVIRKVESGEEIVFKLHVTENSVLAE